MKARRAFMARLARLNKRFWTFWGFSATFLNVDF